MNPFKKLAELGYADLVPIIPPDAEISPNSTLYKRVGTHQDGRGKTPGIRFPSGKWGSFDWINHVADERDFERWHAMGAGVGIKTGKVLLIDADTMHPDLAAIIRPIVDGDGHAPVRTGQAPKQGYVFRTDGDVPYQRVDFGEPNAKGIPERVEVLSHGRQFVALGVHPKTGKPYAWDRPLPPFDQLPLLPHDQVGPLLERLRQALPAARPIVKEGAASDVDQQTLRGDPALIRKAVAATPNTSDHFPTRESYLAMGYAIKAAVPDEREAFDIFSEWCDRWPSGNDPDIVAADWCRMKPPYKRGASWLFDQADALSNGDFTQAEVWFEELQTQEESPFAAAEAIEAKSDALYPLLKLSDVINRPPPSFLIDRHVPDVSVGFLYSTPGAGKSFLAIDMALAIAHGLPDWHGDKINAKPNADVLYIASEGSFDMGNRAKAWHKRRGIGQFTDRFLIIEKSIEFMRPDDIEKLLRTVRAAGVKPALVVVDTVSRAMPGADENLQKDMTLFVKACDRVRDEFQCAVMGVHHAGKSGDMRGSTVLLGAGDFVFKLERKKGASIGTLTCEKQKAAEDGWSEPYRFDVVGLGDGQSSLVAEREVVGFGPGVALTPAVADEVLEAMRAAWESGRPWSKAAQSGDRRAVKHMVEGFGFKGDEAEDLLRVWEGSGLICVAVRDSDKKIKGYKVVGGAGQDVLNDGVFG